MITALVILWTFHLFDVPQQSFQDSIRKAISETNDDSLRAALYYNLSKFYYPFEQDTAILYAENSIGFADKSGSIKMKGNALNIMGVAQLIKSDYEAALVSHLQALKIRESLKDSLGMLESNLNLGNIYYRSGELEKAADLYKKALVYALKLKSVKGQGLLYNNLGSYHRDLWRGDKNQADYDLSVDYLKKSLAIKEELNDLSGSITTLTQLAELSNEVEDYQMGLSLLTRALKITESTHDLEKEMTVLNEMSVLFLKINEARKAMSYGLKAYEIARKMDSQFYISAISENVIKASIALNDYKKAYEFLVIKKASEEAVFTETRQKNRDDLLIQYETEKKELENDQLTAEKELVNLSLQRRNELLAGGSVLLLFFLVLVFIQKNNHRKMKLANRELKESHDLVTKQNHRIQSQADYLHLTNDALSQANKFRDKIFSVISHDLRVPFSSLRGTIELWERKMLNQDEVDEIMSLIARDTNSVYQMLNNLLIWAKTQMNSNEIIVTQFNLNSLVNENTELFQSQVQRKNQELVLSIPEGLEIETDRDRLNFIIRNILMNALKFTPEGGRIAVEYLDINQGELHIKDTGLGMTPKTLSKLFSDKIYSQLGTDGESGTGIGLMLCKEFSESIGAEILVESEVGSGTSFIIRFNARTDQLVMSRASNKAIHQIKG